MHNEIFINEILSLTRELEAEKSIGGLKLAKIIKKLTELEVEEGGPYSLLPGKGAEGINVDLNVAIAKFLALQDIHLPKLDAFLADHTITGHDSVKGVEESERITTSSIYDSGERKIMDLIRKKFEDRFARFRPEVRDRARAAIEKTIRGNTDNQMSLMAYYTRVALGSRGAEISDDVVADMGLANIFFWTAFIIYDDFWDEDEAADAKLLPVANVFARHYTDYFGALLQVESGFRRFFHELMDNLDAANAWETEYCRTKVEGSIFHIPKVLPDYGDYTNKFHPASGHLLGPLALFAMRRCGLDTPEAKDFIAYFRHYLIAMQLNDDAHDWEEDLARGHLSTVVSLLLADVKEAGWKKATIDLVVDMPELKKIFWWKTMPKYVKLVLSHTARSREALHKLRGVFENLEPFGRIITRNENVAKEAEKEFSDSEALLKEYS